MESPLELDLSAVVRHIQSEHHGKTRLLLEEAALLLASASEEVGPAARPLLRSLDRAFAYFRADLLAHFRTEETHVFPYIVALHRALVHGEEPCGTRFTSVKSPIQLMRNEEQGTRRAMARLLRAVAAARGIIPGSERWSAFAAAIQVLRDDLERHAALEEQVLFPAAVDVERLVTGRAMMQA